MQILDQLPGDTDVGYFSGEEQANEVVRRAERIGVENERIAVYHTTSLEDILATAQEELPQVMVVDSIQTISSMRHEGIAGSPAQIKVCADELISFARKNNITLFCLGHVTK